MSDQTQSSTVSLCRMASALRVGRRAAQSICGRHGALIDSDAVDPVRLFAGLGLPDASLAAFQADKPIFVTGAELAARSGLSTRTIRNYVAGGARPAHFPRSVALTPHHRMFFAADMAVLDYGLPTPVSAVELDVPLQAAAAAQEQTPATTRVCFEMMTHLDSLIPDAPRRKRVRKK